MRGLMMATVGLASLTCCAPRGEIPQSLLNDPVWKRANHLPITSEEQPVVDAYDKRAAAIAKQAKAKSSASVDAALALEEKGQQELAAAKFKRNSGKKLTEKEAAIIATADDAVAKAKQEDHTREVMASLSLPPSAASCGWLGCISSPYLKARLSGASTVSEAIGIAGGPDSTVPVGEGTFLTWRRIQMYEGAPLACTETISAMGNRVVAYRFEGHC